VAPAIGVLTQRGWCLMRIWVLQPSSRYRGNLLALSPSFLMNGVSAAFSLHLLPLSVFSGFRGFLRAVLGLLPRPSLSIRTFSLHLAVHLKP